MKSTRVYNEKYKDVQIKIQGCTMKNTRLYNKKYKDIQ